jgi:hypothetical protein
MIESCKKKQSDSAEAQKRAAGLKDADALQQEVNRSQALAQDLDRCGQELGRMARELQQTGMLLNWVSPMQSWSNSSAQWGRSHRSWVDAANKNIQTLRQQKSWNNGTMTVNIYDSRGALVPGASVLMSGFDAANVRLTGAPLQTSNASGSVRFTYQYHSGPPYYQATFRATKGALSGTSASGISGANVATSVQMQGAVAPPPPPPFPSTGTVPTPPAPPAPPAPPRPSTVTAPAPPAPPAPPAAGWNSGNIFINIYLGGQLTPGAQVVMSGYDAANVRMTGPTTLTSDANGRVTFTYQYHAGPPYYQATFTATKGASSGTSASGISGTGIGTSVMMR